MADIVAVDLGTTYFKFALFGRDGTLRALHRLVPPIRRTGDGRWELDAAAFEHAVTEGLTELGNCVRGGLAGADALTFATQTNSFLLLDETGQPLTPLILWPDRRATPLPEPVRRLAASERLQSVTGVPELGPEFMAAKIVWLREQHGARAARAMLISDYLTWLATGRAVTEGGAAGLTGLLDIHRFRWWPEALDCLDFAPELLPQPARAGTDLGPMGPRAARFGLPSSCRFVVGCLDQYAGAIGVGNVLPGGVSETTGTVLASVCCSERFLEEAPPGVFQGPTFAVDRYYRMKFGSTSANYLHWYREQLPDRPEFGHLTVLAEPVASGADGLRLRPSESGPPPVDSSIPGGDADGSTAMLEAVFEGITEQHGRGHFVRCILEAVADALAEQIEAISGEQRPVLIRSAGGAAKSPLWLQLKADRLGVPFAATTGEEPTALGAAILAEAALSDRSVPDIVRQWVQLAPEHRPEHTA